MSAPMATPGTSKPAAGGLQKDKDPGKDEHRNSLRELAETVVFVVVLVLLLKTFVAEAFVIPTGSMAETLYGYQRVVECNQCGYKFPVNAAPEVDPQRGNNRAAITGCHCPNCQNVIRWNDKNPPSWSSGDRVLVAKFLYDGNRFASPKRHEVIVFKFPQKPQDGSSAMNYIKRCVGLSGETLAIFEGDAFVTKSLAYPHESLPSDPSDLWEMRYAYSSDPLAVKLFIDSQERRSKGELLESDFEIVRKTPDVMMEMRRIVFDNDHQPKDLVEKGIHRWRFDAQGRWTGDVSAAPKKFTHASKSADEKLDWLTYNHIIGEVGSDRHSALSLDNVSQPFNQDHRRLITNMLGYNSGEGDPNQDRTGKFWVSDLMIDCTVQVESDQGELVFELSRGIDRFRAAFNVANGECTLTRRTGTSEEQRAKSQATLAAKPTSLKGKGKYRVRFANFDERLTVWVNRSLPFGDGVTYVPSAQRGPTVENDLHAPAQIGIRAAQVSVSHLQVWRDTFYTPYDSAARYTLGGNEHRLHTFYVQPGHYLCLGDNSASSSDSRAWGVVPERLLLGRALMVYFPFWPFNQRLGLIR